ncbi:MAG: hypothetical protein L3K09_00305 [Thermoplasmata archaeon]|nr:hypothetical protein [Thermoplasmata archaeon]
MTSAMNPSSNPAKIAGALLAGVLAAIAILVFVGVYLAFGNDHFTALEVIGTLSLILALAAYLAQSFTRDPGTLRATCWGLFGMGFAVLVLNDAFGVNAGLSTLGRIGGLIVLLVLLAIVLVFAYWRGMGRASTEARLEHREAWAQQPPPSAFSYASARSAAPPGPEPSGPGGPSPPPGGS